MARHDFTQNTKNELSLRAAHFCSNPNCLRLTAGPRAGNSRGLSTGHAAHICAASIGGPRFDADQSVEERKSADNGLWLCRECGDMVDKDVDGFTKEALRTWKLDHETMIAEVRQKGWSESIELLRSGQMAPSLAKEVISLFEDRRTFWTRFDAEFPDRVRISLDGLRYDLTCLRKSCASGSPLDEIIVALGRTVRHFFDTVEQFDLQTLRCDGHDPNWLAFESALRALRKSVGYQIGELAASYQITLQGEFVEFLPRNT